MSKPHYPDQGRSMRSFSHLSAMRPGPGVQSGSSLIEVLVAILLVSIGLLGVAGLSGATQAYNKAAQVRLVGVGLANDLADRARVNIYGFDLGNYDIALGDDSSGATVDAGNLALDPSDAANALKLAQDLAAADVDDFLLDVSNRLPQGDAIVTSTRSAAARDLDVWILWKEPKTDEGDEDDDKGAFSLFDAGKDNCPDALSADEKAEYSCMHFKVGL